MIFRKTTLALAVIALRVLAGLLALPVFAAPDIPAGAREACKADYKQFCNGVQPGGGRILQCLKEHTDQLSPGCKQVVQTAKDQAPAPPPAQSKPQ